MVTLSQKLKQGAKIPPFFSCLLQKISRTIFPEPNSGQLQKVISKHLRHNHSVFFVQVGSNDGIQGDPLHDLILMNKNWTGIFIEPVGFLFDRLKHNYEGEDRFTFEKIAISPDRGTADFFYVSQRAGRELGHLLPYWHDQLGSFCRGHILKHLGGILKPYILSAKIKTLPLQDILDRHKVAKVDLIHIDTEGHDYKVLSTIDFSRYRPAVILYEHKHLSRVEKESAESLLKKNGYGCVKYRDDTLATL